MNRGQRVLLINFYIGDDCEERICISGSLVSRDVVDFKGNAIVAFVEDGNRVEESGVD
jgi:hypothetical protein